MQRRGIRDGIRGRGGTSELDKNRVAISRAHGWVLSTERIMGSGVGEAVEQGSGDNG